MRRLGMVLAALAVVAPAARAASPALPEPGMLMTDGSVTSITRAGDRLVLEGSFRHIGTFVGGGLGIDPASGATDPRFARFGGQVSDAIGDGHGGWYVGGQFQMPGERFPRYLVHLTSSGELDPTFTGGPGDFVSALALAGGRLYATRYFNGGVRAYDPGTGSRITAFGATSGPAPSELEYADGRLYIGSDLGVTAVDPETGRAVEGFDCTACSGDAGVSALAHDDRRLYVGRRDGGLLAVDLATGTADPAFAPKPGSTGRQRFEDEGPLVLAVDGDRLLVGGRRLQFGGPSQTLVALDRSTGAADPGFAAGFTAPVHDMIVRGESLLVGGEGADAQAPPQLFTLDRASGAVRSATDTALDGPVDALADGGGRIFAGGRFGTRGSIRTDGVAEISVATGSLVPGFAVRGLPQDFTYLPPVLAGSRIVLERLDYGGFENRQSIRLRTLSLLSGRRLTAFRPRTIRFANIAGPPGSGHSYAPVVVGDGNRMYVGHILGDTHTTWPWSRIHLLSAATGRLLARFDLPLKGYLTDMAVRGSRLWVSGSFRRWRPDGRPAHLATLVLNPRSGALDPSFDAHTHGPVYDIGLSASRLYLRGIFDRANGVRRANLAAVEPATGVVDRRFGSALRFAPYGGSFGDSGLTPVGAGLLRLSPPYPYASPQFVNAATGRPAHVRTLEGALQAATFVGRRPFVAATARLPYFSSGNHTFVGYLPPGSLRG